MVGSRNNKSVCKAIQIRWTAGVPLFLLIAAFFASPLCAEETPPAGRSLLSNFRFEGGGEVKTVSLAAWYAAGTIYRRNEENPFLDGATNLRLKGRINYTNQYYLETHYEIAAAFGDTYEQQKRLQDRWGSGRGMPITGTQPRDDRRLLNLTHTIRQGANGALYNRLDRLKLVFHPAWGTVSLGRQALTWGNGLLFHPMDLFNPFSPTDIDRDYKTGDDMLSVVIPTRNNGELQLLGVPRRDTASGDVAWTASSLAAQYRQELGSNDLRLMIARHYQDMVIGIGGTGYLADAVWRVDTTWTFLRDDPEADGFFSMVFNMDTSWTLWGLNGYGLMEYHFSGIGVRQYETAWTRQALYQRMTKGELFVLGRSYLGEQVSVELHPLVNLSVTNITNLQDPSGILQYWLDWNLHQDIQLTLGMETGYGRTGTEFGGYLSDPNLGTIKPAQAVFVWLTAYF